MKNGFKKTMLAMGVVSATLSYSVSVNADLAEDIAIFGKQPRQWFAGKFVEMVNSLEEDLQKELDEGIFQGMWEKLGTAIGQKIGESIGTSLSSLFSLGPFINFGSIISLNKPSESQALTQVILEALAKVESNILASIEAQYVDEVLDDINALKNNFANHNARVDHKLRLTDGDVIEIAYMPAAIDILGAFEGSIQTKIENLHNYMLVNSLWVQMLHEDAQYDFIEAYIGALYKLTQTKIVNSLNNSNNKKVIEKDFNLRLQQRIRTVDSYIGSLTIEEWKAANKKLFNPSSIKTDGASTKYTFTDSEPVCTGKLFNRKCTYPWNSFKQNIITNIGDYVLKPCDGINNPKYPSVVVTDGNWSYLVNGKKVTNKYYFIECSNSEGATSRGLHILDSKGRIDSFTTGIVSTLPPLFASRAKSAFERDVEFNFPLMLVSGYSPAQEMLDNWWTQAGFGYDRPHNDLDRFMYSYDVDGDGLTNGTEATYRTNPNRADSDGDGRSDYQEIMLDGSDPLKRNTVNQG